MCPSEHNTMCPSEQKKCRTKQCMQLIVNKCCCFTCWAIGIYWSSFFLSMHSIRIFSNFTNIKSSVGNLAGVDSGSVALLLVKLAATFDIVRQVSWAAIKKGYFFMLAKKSFLQWQFFIL